MTELFKTTKPQGKARAIDSIVKFQIDDGIESLTIGGKEALADLSYDKKGNVTLHFNADKDKIDEIVSLVPFVSVESDVVNDKHTVTLNLDMREFDIKVEGSELVVVKKTKTDITLDLTKIQEKFDEIERKLGEHTEKIKEAEKKIEENGNKIAENLSKINENKAKIQEIVTELVEVGKKIAKNEGDIAENLEKIKSNKTELDKQLAMIEDTNAEVAEAKKAISKNADDIVEQAKKIGELQEKDKMLERRINQNEDNINRVEQDLAVTDSKADTLEGKVDSEIGKLKEKDVELDGEISELKFKDSELESKIVGVQGKLDDFKNENTQSIEDVKRSIVEESNKLNEFKSDYSGDKSGVEQKLRENSTKIEILESGFTEAQRVQDERTENYNNERKAKEEQLENSVREIITLLKVNKPSEEDKAEVEAMIAKIAEKVTGGTQELDDLQYYLNELRTVYNGESYAFDYLVRSAYSRIVSEKYSDSEIQEIVDKLKHKYNYNEIILYDRLQYLDRNISDIMKVFNVNHNDVKKFEENYNGGLYHLNNIQKFQSELYDNKDYNDVVAILNNFVKAYSLKKYPYNAFENAIDYKKEYDNKEYEKAVGEAIDFVLNNRPNPDLMDNVNRIYYEITQTLDLYKVREFTLNKYQDMEISGEDSRVVDELTNLFLNSYGVVDNYYVHKIGKNERKEFTPVELNNLNIVTNETNGEVSFENNLRSKVIGYYNTDGTDGRYVKSELFTDYDGDKYYVSHTGIQKAIDNTVIGLYIKGSYYNKTPRLENCTLLNNFDTQNGSILLIKISNLGQSVIDFS